MTTIATDGVTIAADGLGCYGSEVAHTSGKKIHVREGAIYALSGLTGMGQSLIEWIASGAKPSDVPPCSDDSDWTLLVVNADGRRLYTKACPYPQTVGAMFSFGSGGDYAMGAMCAGKSAAEAIQIVIDKRLDVYTGGEIQVIDIKKALGLREPGLRMVNNSKD